MLALLWLIPLTLLLGVAALALFAWTVAIPPGWPVFQALSMSSASAPLTSPTMIRSGRRRRVERTRSAMETAPGRVLSATVSGAAHCSSRVSSIRITRSSRAASSAEPAWAKRMRRGQALKSGAAAVTHAVRSGDRGGSGTSVSLSEDR